MLETPTQQRRRKEDHMLKATVFWSEKADAYKAGKESAEKALAELKEKPGLVVAFCTVHYDEADFAKGIRDVLGDIPLMGSTSFGGILTPGGYVHKETGVGGVMLLASPEMAFGVGGAEIGEDLRAAGQEAVRAAITQAGKSESDPVSALYLIPPPGTEERLIQGIEDVVGRVPLIGGSAANQGGEDPWKQFANDKVMVNGVVVGAIYSELPFGAAYSGYFKPTDNHGVITKVRDRRNLVEINGRQALDVYAEWRGMKVDDLMGGKILLESVPFPLGRRDIGADHWWIMHPVNANEDGSIDTGSDMAEGMGVTLMEASLDEVAQGASEVVKMTLDDLGGEAGAVIIGHCGGRAMALGTETMEKVGADIKAGLGDIPFIGWLTFGEQGYCKWAGTGAGGLMLNAIAFGK
jgi:hypothetical protein